MTTSNWTSMTDNNEQPIKAFKMVSIGAAVIAQCIRLRPHFCNRGFVSQAQLFFCFYSLKLY